MEHNEAQQQEAVERYLLNEMNDAEAEAFEAHFFDCAICAEEIRAGTRMMAAGKVVAKEAAAQEEREGGGKVVPFPFLKYLATAASVVFALLTGNAYLRVIPQLQQQVAVATQPSMELVVPPEPLQIAVRGAENEIVLPAGKPAMLTLGLPEDPEKTIVRYDTELRKDDGTVRLKDTASPTPDQSKLNLLLGSLPAGSYVLTIHGVGREGNRTENVTTYELKVQ